jgi:hypothetical protein
LAPGKQPIDVRRRAAPVPPVNTGKKQASRRIGEDRERPIEAIVVTRRRGRQSCITEQIRGGAAERLANCREFGQFDASMAKFDSVNDRRDIPISAAH